MHEDGVLADVGTRLLFENDRVRVWDLCLPPGEASGVHRHQDDYLYIVIGDGQLQRRDADGSLGPVKTMQDGDVVFRSLEGDDVHEAVNAGDGPWRNIVVELIDQPGDEIV
jgi:quercetin dioxygenase-like cupin family protein